MYKQYKEGWLEVISGCMFAGKTEELIRRIKVLEYANKKIAVCKPRIDDRYGESSIVSHSGFHVNCFAISKARDIFDYVDDSYDVLAIDEVQFLDDEIIDICDYFANKGMRVMVAGLDMDFRGEAFGVMPKLFTQAEFVTKLTAVCVKCGAPATRSQRLLNGSPAHVDEVTISIGAKEQYEARCRHCHVVPGKKMQGNYDKLKSV